MRGDRSPNVSDLAEQIRLAADSSGPGPLVLEMALPRSRLVRVAQKAAVEAGYQLVTRQNSGYPDDAHRHVLLMVDTPGERVWAARYVKALARVSPRCHVVLRRTELSPRPQRLSTRGSGNDGPEDDGWLRALIGGADFERAEAWCAALRTEAELLGRVRRDETLCLTTWLMVWQARFEEARDACRSIRQPLLRRGLERVIARAACCDGSRPRSLRLHGIRPGRGPTAVACRNPRDVVVCRTDAGRRPISSALLVRRASSRWPQGAAAMFLLPAIPTLLEDLGDATDEAGALADVAAWARRHAGAGGVAFVGDEGRLVAVEGWAGRGPSADDRLNAARVPVLEEHVRGSLVLVVAAIRHAGGHVGGLLLQGPAARRSTLVEAAGILAVLAAPALRLRLEQLSALQQTRVLMPEVIGSSPSAAAIRDDVVRTAATPFAVVVEGESGTGKELVARALHRLSARRARRFVAVNCAALSDELVEAELFGHSRGAFTGAVAPRTGLFEDADGGTLFLDEVADLSARGQAKLLRVLQEHEVRRVGENASRAVDVRVVAATNRPLVEACAAGHFREDLLFRLAVVRIRLPPLRERAEDIAPIARAFWSRTMREVGKRAVLAVDALGRLASHQWPGNVRELQNVVAGLALVAPMRGRVTARHVDRVLADAGGRRPLPPMSLEHARRMCERQTVAAALARHAGRRTAAARELGLTRQGLAKVIRRLHMDEASIEGVA